MIAFEFYRGFLAVLFAISILSTMANHQPHGEAAGYFNNDPERGDPYAQQQQQYGSEKPLFDQAFKLEKPKYNDLWAAILVWRIHPSLYAEAN